ncbi:MAG: class I SAM-dependent methyltransferase, partial [Bacteroidota bacterium]
GGRNIHWLLHQGFDVTALDANPEAIEFLRTNYPKHPNRFHLSTLENFPSDTSYDFIICNAVLHFARNHAHFDAMFDRLADLLAPEGYLFIRMTSEIGLEGHLGPAPNGVYDLPDGSIRYLLTRPKVDLLLQKHGLHLQGHVKTVLVERLRSMTTLVLRK